MHGLDEIGRFLRAMHRAFYWRGAGKKVAGGYESEHALSRRLFRLGLSDVEVDRSSLRRTRYAVTLSFDDCGVTDA